MYRRIHEKNFVEFQNLVLLYFKVYALSIGITHNQIGNNLLRELHKYL